MKQATIVLIAILITNIVNAQNTNLESFNSKFSIVANKSAAWNSLIDFLKPTNTLTYYKLTQDTIWKDPCMAIAQQDMSCRQIDYIVFFKRAEGSDTIVTKDGVRVLQGYKYETNSRSGSDIVTNIDSIRSVTFYWKITPKNNKLSKTKLRAIYLNLYNEISPVINNYYGNSIEESSSQDDEENFEYQKYWTYRNNRSILAVMALIWNKNSKEYRILFSGNIQKVN